MRSNEGPKILTMTRKVQVLNRFEGYCPICRKITSQILVYVYKKEKMPIPLLFVIIWRYYPDFYGVVCEECNFVLRTLPYKEMAKRYGRSWLTLKHKYGIEQKPRQLQIKFLKK